MIFDEKNNEKVNKTAKISQNIEINKETKKDNEKEIKINNSLCGADKSLKNSFIKEYENIKEFLSNKEYNSVANLMQKAIPEVVSEKNVLFSFKNNFEVVLFDKNIIEIQKLLKQIFEKKYSIVAVNIDEWNDIKKEYIYNIKKHFLNRILGRFFISSIIHSLDPIKVLINLLSHLTSKVENMNTSKKMSKMINQKKQQY